jgi:WD40 repeat protein
MCACVCPCVCANAQDATVVVSGSYDRTVRLWDMRSNNRDPIQVCVCVCVCVSVCVCVCVCVSCCAGCWAHAQLYVP